MATGEITGKHFPDEPKGMGEIKSFIIRLISNIILIPSLLFIIIFMWKEINGFDYFCVILCAIMIYIIIFSPIFAHTSTQKEIDEQEGDFMCDC